MASFPGKAQCVEAELITCNREEVSQLHKLVAQKDDDLQRTVQKYEEVLQVLQLFIYIYVHIYVIMFMLGI